MPLVIIPVPSLTKLNRRSPKRNRETFNAPRYTLDLAHLFSPVIRNFKDKETQKIFERQRSRKLPSDIQ